MLAFIEITLQIGFVAALILVSAAIGFILSKAALNKQKSIISKLEVEMLQSHAEILQLHKELSDKENIQSKTPIFSIKDAAAESLPEQLPGVRLTKKIVSGGGKSTS
ncbi:MAG: hypothetical protein ABI813_04705 [Bacteroidota bacterium]